MSSVEAADPLSPSRRRFLVGGLGAGGALLVGWGLWPQSIDRLGGAALWSPDTGATPLNGWISIGTDGQVRLAMPRLEMGQGVHTALTMLVAEQLGMHPAQISLTEAGTDRIYANAGLPARVLQFDTEDRVHDRLAVWLPPDGHGPWWQITAGSSSVADAWRFLPLVAATARMQLLGAAALRWRVPLDELAVAQGVVRHVGLGLKAHYGELVVQALRVPLGRVELLPRQDWQLLGQPVPRIDLPPKVRGAQQHAADVRPVGLLHAAVRMAPRLGLKPHRVDEAALRSRPGVVLVTTLPALAGAPAALAVLARTTWHARQALAAAQIEWRPADDGHTDGTADAAASDSDRIAESLAAAARRACTGSSGDVLHERGKPAALGSSVLAVSASGEMSAGGLVEALYQTPFQPHLTLEPPSCTAQVSQGQVQLWLATQVPELARTVAAEQAGVAPEAVRLQTVAAGGSFGRRLEVDVVAQTVHLARQAEGRPVQLMWAREEDLRQDRCRPAVAAVLQAGLGPDGLPLALVAGFASDAVAPLYRARAAPGRDLPRQLAGDGVNAAEVAAMVPYHVEWVRLGREEVRSGVAVGYGRGGAAVGRIFALEGFINELADAARQDPLAYRLALLADRPLHRAVLQRAAAAAGWGKLLPAGRARGLALGTCRGSIVAQVVEVSLVGSGAGQKVRVHRVVCAVDCGTVINPEIVRQQIEGGVIEALTAALHGGIDIRAGEVQQRNFNDLPLLSLADTPVVETVLIDSERDPAGVGEIALPPLAPALAGAIHALTGRWLRRLPLRLTA